MTSVGQIYRTPTPTAIVPLDTTKLDWYLNQVLGPPDFQPTYMGHGPKSVANWEEYRDNGNAPYIEGLGFYDFGRTCMQAYYYRKAKGDINPDWIAYAASDAMIWNKYYSEASTPYVVGGWRVFSAGAWMLYNHDPVAYSWVPTMIRGLTEKGSYTERNDQQGSIGYFASERNTREISYAIDTYLDFYRINGYTDPIYTNGIYHDRVDKLKGYCTQWLDDYAIYGLSGPMEYLSRVEDREVGWYNILELSPFQGALICEAMIRLVEEDPAYSADVVFKNRIVEITDFVFKNGWDASTEFMVYRWYNCGTCSDGLPVDICGTETWCHYTGGAGVLTLFQMLMAGWCYSYTGDRKYLYWGDRSWDSFWVNAHLDYYAGPHAGKRYNQTLRYAFDYLVLRGDMPTLKTHTQNWET